MIKAEIKVDGTDEFYAYYNDHKRAIYLGYKDDGFRDDYKLWDTITLWTDSPRWRDVALCRRISYIEYAPKGILLHLKS